MDRHGWSQRCEGPFHLLVVPVFAESASPSWTHFSRKPESRRWESPPRAPKGSGGVRGSVTLFACGGL